MKLQNYEAFKFKYETIIYSVDYGPLVPAFTV